MQTAPVVKEQTPEERSMPASAAANDMPPPWEDIPPEAMEAPQDFANNEPPVWDDVPMDAAPLESMAQPRAPKVAEPSASDVLQETALGGAWYAVVTQLDEAQAITALVRELAMQSQLVAQDGGAWSLQVQRTSLNQAMPRERLLKALASVSDCTSLTVENGAVHDTPALRNKARAEAKQKQAEAIVMNDPQVQQLVQSLGATIVPGSIRPV